MSDHDSSSPPVVCTCSSPTSRTIPAPAPGRSTPAWWLPTPLLHPHVRQARRGSHPRPPTTGRQPGEIIPLATLTHELNGGADCEGPATGRASPRPAGARSSQDDATPSVSAFRTARAPPVHGTARLVRVFDGATADAVVTYGFCGRATVLDEVGVLSPLSSAEQPIWPGDSLLPALGRPPPEGDARRLPKRGT